MADPRIIEVSLDERTIPSRSPAIERERRIAMQDLLHANRFVPLRIAAADPGPYRVALRVEDGRLAIDIADRGGAHLETLLLGLARLKRAIRDYFALVDSHHDALGSAGPARIETIDMARRGLHDEGAALLRERLEGKIEIDFDTARRLFTLICALHIRT